MDVTVRKELGRIVDTLVETGIISKIILFGSYARGEETPGSDIDICVLTPVEDDDDGQRLTDITVSLRIKLIDIRERPLDLLTFNQDEFSASVARQRSFQRHIMEHGVVLYG
jgi:predicted nucleotidyltransferase